MSGPMLCRTCGIALDLHSTPTTQVYEHPVWSVADHPAEPEPAPPGWRGFCDFCTVKSAEFIVPVRPFILAATEHASTSDWQACPTCSLLISTARWDSLTSHSVAQIERRYGGTSASPEQVRQVRLLHEAVRTHMTGPPRRLGEPS
ncbi:hypothetical protein JOD54_001953 [Actinokineospora baliensis]|uniref:hypothetical protein n=1 Tax=Actinokineospora baliensis TaxID=547056 RepID=UPI0019567E9F|nr:hypothetical protein [Actinokineospora baliensis]MBM7771749.1 hypothetical protein [Actinokineospora baliensis]